MKRFVPAAFVALLAIWLAGPARAQTVEVASVEGSVTLEDGSELWFVELSSPPTAEDGDLGTILAEQSTFRALASGIRYTEKSSHKTLWNGLTVAVHPADVAKLRRLPGVTLYPVVTMQVPETTPVDQIELLTALSMTGADIAQNSLGLTGAGIRVGIIDTGMDYDHADLGGDGVHRVNSSVFPTGRVVAGTDLVGDNFTGGNTPMPDPYPDDCNGHGTHVGGIVGASGGVTGVAPGVVFGAYRVIGCGNTTNAAMMIQAMELALADDMDVINMSIGAALQWPSYPTAQAADRLVNKGVVVVASIGNSGLGQPGCCLYASSAPGVGKKVIGVASYDNTHINSSAFTISPDDRAVIYSGGIDVPPAPTSGTESLARTGMQTSTADACSPLPAGSLTGKVALIRRGTCSFYIKATNAVNAGAIGVVIYNNVAGGITPIVTGTPPVTIPVVGITAADGAVIDGRIAAGPTTLTWTEGISSPLATGGFISSFSSHGLSPDLTVKPDVGAPGGLIRSTVPLNQGGYANISGTSMSSPHVAGAAALLLQAKPNTTTQQVRNIFQNSAQPRPRSATIPQLDLVHRQGAGLINIPTAVQATTRIEPGKLSLGETEGGSVTGTLSITNEASHAVSYTLTHQAALASGPGTFGTVSLFNAPSTVAFSQNPVVVPAGGTASVDVTVTPHAGLADRSMAGGYVLVAPDDGGEDVRVPYAAFKGDYQSIQVLVPTASGFPWLAQQVGNTFFNRPAGATYTMQGVDIPIILAHFDHQSSKLTMEVFDANTGDSWHRFVDIKEFQRNTSATGFFAFGWDGRTAHGNQIQVVPNGQYVVRLSVLKALGDNSNPAHTESWTSPVITLARPDLLVESFWVSQNSVEEGDQVTLSAAVKNGGASAVSGVIVEFFSNDVSLGASTVELAAGEIRVVEAPWLVGAESQHRIRVKITPMDDEVSFSNNEVGLDVIPGQAIVGVGGPQVRVLSLAPARPNPFNGKVAFLFTLPKEGPVSFEVFDLAGRRLKSWRWSSLAPGEHTLDWDGRTDEGRGAPAGTVLLRLNAMGRSLTQKAVRLP